MTRILRTLLHLFLVLGLTAFAFGQAETGQVTGTITDPSGAVVPGATVTIKSANTGAVRTTVSNAAGAYTASNLKPDVYDVTIEAQGFQKNTRRVTVPVGSSVEVSAVMSVGSSGTTVEVTSDTNAIATVNTETQTLSQVVGAEQLAELPTLTRNPYDLVATAGNVGDTERSGANGNSARGAGFNINGQRSASTDVLLDGGENVDLYTATVGQSVPLDSVQELRVVTSSFTAEYGRAGGGVVNVATKSGTNKFHGSGYEFNRISALAANTYENNAQRAAAFANGTCTTGADCEVGKKGVFTRNQFGYSLGGPVIKDKLFFFTNTEWIRVRSNSLATATVVDPDFLNLPQVSSATKSFFSKWGALKSNAVVLGKYNWGSQTSSNLLSASSPFLERVQYSVGQDAGGGSPQNTWMSVNRFDYNLSDKTTLYGRYASSKTAYFNGVTSSSPYAGFDTGEGIFNNNILLNATHVFTPNLVSQSKFIYSRLSDSQPLGTQPSGPTLYYSNLGVPTVEGSLLLFPGYTPDTPGNSIPYGGPQNLYQFYQDLSWTKGKHQFRAGAEYIHTRDNRTFGAYMQGVSSLVQTSNDDQAYANLVNGQLAQYQAAVYPQGKAPCYRDINTGSYIQTPECTLDLPVTAPSFTRHNRYHDGAAYLQDSWKATPRLTLNLGVRWEYYGVQHNDDASLDSNFFPGSGANMFEQIRNGSVRSGVEMWHHRNNNFAPRLGFAWDVFGDGKSSVHGGYGIGYERNFGNVTFNVIQNPPNYAVISVTPDDLGGSLSIPTDNAGPLSGTGQKLLPAASLRAVDPKIKTANTQSYNLAIDREIANGTVLSLEYSGAKGTHLYDIANVNVPTTGGLYLGDARFANRMNLQYSNINWRGSNGFSSYNGLNVKLASNNLFHKGLGFTANYTWSHSIDNLSNTFSEGGNGTFQLGYTDPFDPARDKGNSEYDATHRLVVSGTWSIPWGDHAQSALVRQALGGWNLSPIFTARTGTPFTIYDCSNGYYNCPRFSSPSPISTTGEMGAETATNQFSYITLPTTGVGTAVELPECTGLYHTGCSLGYTDIGRNAYRGPSNWDFNIALGKTFTVTEQVKVQFRSELYNAFNHHNAYVLTNNAEVSSGDVTSIDVKKGGYGDYRDERRNVQFGLKVLF